MGKKFFIERVFDLSDPYNLEINFQFQITIKKELKYFSS